MRRLLLIAMMVCCGYGTAFAAAENSFGARIVAIRPDGSVTLSSGSHAAFANILLPDAGMAEAWLAEHALQQPITFTAGDEDRYGRLKISSAIEWKMLREGIAVIYLTDTSMPAGWLAAEKAAENGKKGIWKEKSPTITTENAAQHNGEFHIIEGRVTRVFEGSRVTYVNFGNNWREDFSINIPAKTRHVMQGVLQRLKPGSTVRVRGTIYEENGPMIKLLQPDNLELR